MGRRRGKRANVRANYEEIYRWWRQGKREKNKPVIGRWKWRREESVPLKLSTLPDWNCFSSSLFPARVNRRWHDCTLAIANWTLPLPSSPRRAFSFATFLSPSSFELFVPLENYRRLIIDGRVGASRGVFEKAIRINGLRNDARFRLELQTRPPRPLRPSGTISFKEHHFIFVALRNFRPSRAKISSGELERCWW